MQVLGCEGVNGVAHGLSSYNSWALECTLSGCCAQALLLHGMWYLPRPGIEAVSPELAGVFLTTGSPGKFLGKPFLHTRALIVLVEKLRLLRTLVFFPGGLHWKSNSLISDLKPVSVSPRTQAAFLSLWVSSWNACGSRNFSTPPHGAGPCPWCHGLCKLMLTLRAHEDVCGLPL